MGILHRNRIFFAFDWILDLFWGFWAVRIREDFRNLWEFLPPGMSDVITLIQEVWLVTVEE